MTIRVLAASALILACACDDEPKFSAEPGIEVCEIIVDECAELCDTEPDPADPSDHVDFSCSLTTDSDFVECGLGIVRDEGLQEVAAAKGALSGSAVVAAEGVVVGYNRDCSVLSSFPVFCYDCRD